jgi:hypothetical protein
LYVEGYRGFGGNECLLPQVGSWVVTPRGLVVIVPTQYDYDDQIEMNEMDGACSTFLGKRRGIYRVWWGNLRRRDNLEDPVVDGRIILGWAFRKWDVGACTGLGWLRIGTSGGHL